MIPMSCPNCGSQGEVPLDRLNSRLKCRKCGTMFYMDETGSIVLGDPNDPKKGRRRKKAESGPAIDFDFDVRRMIQDIPKPVRIGVLALVVVAAVGYGASSVLGSLGTPTDVKGRSALVADLFVDNKLAELQALAKPGTGDDLAKWHETMRPKLNYEGARRSRGDVATDGAIMNEGSSEAWSFGTLAVVRPDPTSGGAASDDGPKNALSLSLYWTRENGEWLLDGSRCLQEALKPPPTSRSTRGGRR
ncbi:hypothetical protein [Tautonia rosea]|uniref:hypothetical protein n=1 Tax=Tautonia rosea TaxID=2728037 RepID=UPI0014759715|nr:hypothetical protein [Tautonia rosea]